MSLEISQLLPYYSMWRPEISSVICRPDLPCKLIKHFFCIRAEEWDTPRCRWRPAKRIWQWSFFLTVKKNICCNGAKLLQISDVILISRWLGKPFLLYGIRGNVVTISELTLQHIAPMPSFRILCMPLHGWRWWFLWFLTVQTIASTKSIYGLYCNHM